MKKSIKKVLAVFGENYKEIPLEVFGKDPYKILISTLLSSRTKDEVTLEASKRLFEIAPNLKILSKLDVETLRKTIYPVGFYKTKAKQLKKLAEILVNEFNSQIPSIRNALMRLPGVGRKTANLVLNRAFGKPAIAVDTHVHKISNLLGWVNTKTPEKTEEELMKIIPKKYRREINRLFVSTGRQYNTNKKLTDFLKKNHLLV